MGPIAVVLGLQKSRASQSLWFEHVCKAELILDQC